jgi:hypothetical protein
MAEDGGPIPGLNNERLCLTSGGDGGDAIPGGCDGRKRVIPARPWGCRTISFVIVFTPSVPPLWKDRVGAAPTGSWSCSGPQARERAWGRSAARAAVVRSSRRSPPDPGPASGFVHDAQEEARRDVCARCGRPCNGNHFGQDPADEYLPPPDGTCCAACRCELAPRTGRFARLARRLGGY